MSGFLFGTPGTQSPKAYDLNNLQAPQIGARLFPVSAAETAAAYSPDTTYFYDDARRFKVKGDGATDDGPAINKGLAILAAATGTNTLKVLRLPKPATSYLIDTAIVTQPGVSLLFNPEDIAAASTQAATLPLFDLLSMWGITEQYYKSAYSIALTVDPNNGALANPIRYWSIIGAAEVPAGATVVAGDVKEDHVGVTGIGRSKSNNSRIWGVAGIAQADQAAATDAEMGFAAGGEFDINNNTGRVYADWVTNLTFTAIQVGVGGTQNAMTGVNLQGGAGGKFVAGLGFKGGCLATYAAYFDDVAPVTACFYLSNNYTGGPALHVKNGVDAIYLRNAGNTDFVGRINGQATYTQHVGGAGNGVGTPGVAFVNHANSQTNLQISDAGTVVCQRDGLVITTDNTAGVVAVGNTVSGVMKFTAATQITQLAAGEYAGQRVRLYTTRVGGFTLKQAGGGVGVNMVLTGSVDAVLNQYSTVDLFYDGGSWIEVSRSAK